MTKKTILCLATLSLFASTAAYADDYTNSSSYNHGYGQNAGAENAAINPTLRDSNGNLTNVNGQFTGSSFSSQAMATSSSGQSLANLGRTNSGAAFGGATAIGNSLNVVTVGNNNTVIVSAHQTNTGTVSATVKTNGSK